MTAASLIGKRVEVLDKGYIELVDLMPHPLTEVSGDLAIVNAARVSYLGDSRGEERDKRLLFYLMRNRHTSPFEMVEFKFRCRAPLLTWWQWVRHRTWNANAQSGRYTPFAEDDYYVPEEWRKQARGNRQASEGALDEDTGAELQQTCSHTTSAPSRFTRKPWLQAFQGNWRGSSCQASASTTPG